MSSLLRALKLNGNTPGMVLKGVLGESPLVMSKAEASSGMRGNTRNTFRSNRKRMRGIRVSDGDYVHRGYIIAKQVSGFRWYPGAHVTSGKRKMLTAQVSGTIRFTKEIFIPGPESPEAEDVAKLPKGAFMYKTCVNVVPEIEVGEYELVETI